MKKKLLSLLALVCMTLTASADVVPTYALTKATDAEAHGTITFKVGENTVTSAAEGQTVTVAIEPNTGWSMGSVQGLWYAAAGSAKAPKRVLGNIDLLKDFELEPVEGNPNAFTFVMKRANAEISVSYRKLLTHADITIEDIDAVTYTGQALTPDVTVKDGDTVLKEGTDYTVSYSNNVDAGTATVTMTGKGNYEGTKTAEFTIGKATLTVTAEDATVFFGNELPAFTVSYEGFVNNETKAVLSGTLAFACDYTTESPVGSTFAITPSGLTSDNYDIIFVNGTLTVVVDQNAPYKETLQTAIAIASNINPEALADAIAAAQAAMTAEDATAESLTQANQTLEAAIKTYFGEVLPNLGAIVTALNEETLNTAYADAEAALAKEDVTLQELVAAMQQIIAAAKAVAPEHLQNLKGYAEKYGAEDAASLITLVDNALAAIEAGNVAQIIATMTAVKEAATPLAQQVLSTMINYVQAFGLTEQAAQAQAALEGGNYITMITTAKELFSHLIAAAKEYLPKLGAIAEGLNDETLNTAYAAAQALLAKESITPEELAAAMQNIITAAKAVAPEHLQNLKGYAEKYGAEDAASLITLVDNALAAIEAGNVAQIIATMTAVKTAATPLAQQVLSTMINYVQAFGLTEQATQAQAALEGGNYITMITTAKELFSHLIAAAKEYLPKLGAIAEGLNDETLNTAYAAAQELLAKESITPEELAAAMQNIITAAKAVAPEHLQDLKGYAEKYGAEDAASLITLVDNALAAIEAGNVAQIIATMTAVKTAATPLAQQVLSTMINYVQAFGLTEQAAQAQAALDGGNYITMITTAKALFTHLIVAAKEYLPKLGAIAEGLNDETLNSAYAAAQELLAKESITPEELATAMQNIIVAAKAVAPEHLQNLKGYAEKYGAEDAASLITLVDNALAAIEAGNVAQIIATMTAVKEAATPLAQQVLSTMINYVQAFGLTEQATQAQAALEGGNYITMITTAKELFSHLIAAAKEYLPKLGAIAEGLNDETLNTAYAAAQALLAKESITPEELATAMQNIITAAKAVAPEHLQNLKGYAVKYGATDAATLVDNALAAIEAGNVSQIIATMTAVKEAATPLAQTVLGTMKTYVQQFGLTDLAAQAQAALEGGNYITMITTAKELFSHLIAAAKEYLPKLGAIAEGLNDETLNSAYAAAQALLAKESITPEELAAAMQNIITAAKAVAPEHLQNLKGYAVKYGAEDAASLITLVDNALAAIEAGNVAQIIATMTAVKEAATPLATAILTQMIEKAQSYTGFEEDITEAQAALASGNYITMITAAKALYAKLQAVVTGVGSMKAAFEKDVWYDLNGHKLNGKPTKKGVYFINGRKVVVK